MALDRTELKAREGTALHLWIFNPSDQRLAAGKLYVLTPKHLEVRDVTCAGERLTMPVATPALDPGALASVDLCIRAGARVREGAAMLNVLVTYDGRWAGGQRSAMISAQQELKVGLFGTETVAGVSLSLLALVLPGALLLWGAEARDWKGPVERGTVSVLLSLLIALPVSAIAGSAGLGLISAWDFIAMCAVGAGIGFLGRTVQNEQERRRKKKLVPREGEGVATTLRKLIEMHPGTDKPRSALGNSKGEVFIGSLAGRDVIGNWVLAGYFTVKPKPDGKVTREQLERAQRRGQLSLARLVEKHANEVELQPDSVMRGTGSSGKAIAFLPGGEYALVPDAGKGNAVLAVAPP